LPSRPREEALREADAVILAVPDNLIERIAAELVPSMRTGAMLVVLDAAAPFAGQAAPRSDVTYVVTHPCHPSVFNVETDPDAQRDYFGGIKAKQSIVCALMQGPEHDYEPGEALCRRMFAPVERAHRVTVEQMIILEPVLSGDHRRHLHHGDPGGDGGVDPAGACPRPPRATSSSGHLNIEMAIVFEEIGSPFSDGAKKAIEKAKGQIFRPDWKKVFDAENVRETVAMITQPPPSRGAAPALQA
jgi:hypothetical protein